jgi:hypothetical protein
MWLAVFNGDLDLAGWAKNVELSKRSGLGNI